MATTIPPPAPMNAPAVAPPKKNAPAPKNKKPKRTFMLHSPVDMSALGRFVSTDWRYAGLKAASRGHTKILLRQTGTREVREFEGSKVEIPPKTIVRGTREIVYNNRPAVKFVRKFTYAGAVDDNAKVANNPTAPGTTA
jgi:hypothetical protein